MGREVATFRVDPWAWRRFVELYGRDALRRIVEEWSIEYIPDYDERELRALEILLEEAENRIQELRARVMELREKLDREKREADAWRRLYRVVVRCDGDVDCILSAVPDDLREELPVELTPEFLRAYVRRVY